MRRIIVVWVLLAGCGGATPPPASVVLTGQGAEPRAVVRVVPVAGAVDRVQLTAKLRTRTTFEDTVMEQGQRAIDLPSVQVVGASRIADIGADGSFRTELVIESAKVLDDVVDARVRPGVAAQVEALRGITVNWRRWPDGRVDVLTMHDELPGLADGLRDALGGGEVRFPDVPVGIGAAWTVTSSFASNGVRWLRTTTCRVRDRNANAVTIDVEVELRADAQVLHAEPNATTRLKAGRGHASGQWRIPLDGTMAIGDGRSTLELDVLLTRGHLRIASTVSVESVVSVTVAP